MAQNYVQITDSNKSPLIQILSWFFIVVVILSVIARCATKLHMTKTLKLDDWLAVAATCEYATDLLYVASLGLAKMSTAATVFNLAIRAHRNIIYGIDAVVIAWAVSGLTIVLFQCQLPAPWDIVANSCIARAAFWKSFCTVNIVTDVVLVGIMFQNIRTIQTSWNKKAIVISVFGSRIFVSPALVFQIIYSDKSLATADPTFDMWEWSVIMAVVQCLSILTICIPNLKPFLDSLQSGQMRIDDLRRQGKSSSNGYGSYQRSGIKSGQSNGSNRSGGLSNGGQDTTISQNRCLFELVEIPKQGMPKEGPKAALKFQDGTAAWEGQSHTSQSILIQQTNTWHVDVETT